MTPPAPRRPRSLLDVRIARVFTVIAVLEAFTWAGLLVGMYLKYVTRTTDAWVSLFGALHGGAFIAYVLIALVAAWRLRWSWWIALITLVAAIPPLATIPMDLWLLRRGDLPTRRQDAAATAQSTEQVLDPDPVAAGR